MEALLRVLDEATVAQLGGGDVALALEDVKAVIRLMRLGEAQMPAENHIDLGTPLGKAYALPARVGGSYNAAGVKWTAHRPQRPDALPAALALTLINDAQSGIPRGLLASGALTAARTAAVSALALQLAAPRPVKRVLLLGAGLHAQAHLRMLQQLFPQLEQIGVWNRSPFKLNALREVQIETDLQLALAQPYDAVLTCTSAEQPIIDATAVQPGRIIVQVGYHEVSFAAIKASSKVVVDAWGDFAQRSAKSLFQMFRAGEFGEQDVAADLAALLLDNWRPQPEDSVYFSSFGLNVFDIALAARVLQAAEHDELGSLQSLFSGVLHDH
ncbi:MULTISPECIES: ornithine cyclodeaminase [unclassified Enterobacter]|jgi:ornithine cyclodeaminase|uniref:ornithine cyclodeaminase n=1 Tax=unclassified Enterobacter TaxID=2608935 RepID=UPI0015CB7B2A|nr:MULTISPECIES: ornithine cyclodeaminase [unclassified Enterobacter]MBB3304608.1 ornithine cyclodeaminase [Enterobacter sp. Sphag1F]NYI13424.1 ornithine cyclodeaminase [Enterobacter sp. Sphag71]